MSGNGVPPSKDADKGLGDIVAEVSEKASLLVRQEIELAKAEVSDKVTSLARGAAMGAAAGVFLIFGVTMLFHFLSWFVNDLFDWSNLVWPGYGIVTLVLFILAGLAGWLAARLFKKGAPPTPDMAIEEARRTKAELEAQKIERDQVDRSLQKGEELKA
ncbi:MAG TPA: phage holin family protein [Thermoleophilaceae bacterium]|nr:phage holin family protein [Thermoleophilaceae bacterium]